MGLVRLHDDLEELVWEEATLIGFPHERELAVLAIEEAMPLRDGEEDALRGGTPWEGAVRR